MTYRDRVEFYLQRYGTSEFGTNIEAPSESSHFVVIPAYLERDIVSTLESLLNCRTPELKTEVIVVVNHRETDSNSDKQLSEKIFNKVLEWIDSVETHLKFDIVYVPDLPAKTAGVGMARKIGMDRAVIKSARDCIITCLDADCQVAPNYLVEIEDYFSSNPRSPGASIYFEHPFESEAIIQYELHLRYLNQAQRYAGFPWAFHTVGSAMTVRGEHYVREGGMNKRKAGEDFYFLHKIIALGDFGEINSTAVYPSARKSDRVPFGTGAAMNKWDEQEQLTTYPFQAFAQLKNFNNSIESIYAGKQFPNVENAYSEYLKGINASEAVRELKGKSTSFEVFEKHYFHWMNAFKVMKFLNTLERRPVVQECVKFLKEIGYEIETEDSKEVLVEMRKLERGG